MLKAGGAIQKPNNATQPTGKELKDLVEVSKKPVAIATAAPPTEPLKPQVPSGPKAETSESQKVPQVVGPKKTEAPGNLQYRS